MEIEHIVADGGSSDRTCHIVRSRAPGAQITSEPDRGIYDGMNRGIRLAAGSVVGILNADDFYVTGNALRHVANALDASRADVCYGNVMYVSRDDPGRVLRVWRGSRYRTERLRRGWMPPHPTFFVRRECYESLGMYREDFGTAADYELIVRFLVKERLRAVYVPDLWVAMRVGGASNASLQGRLRANRMDRRAWTVNGVRPSPFFRLLKPARKLPQYARIGRRGLERELRSFLEECGETQREES